MTGERRTFCYEIAFTMAAGGNGALAIDPFSAYTLNGSSSAPIIYSTSSTTIPQYGTALGTFNAREWANSVAVPTNATDDQYAYYPMHCVLIMTPASAPLNRDGVVKTLIARNTSALNKDSSVASMYDGTVTSQMFSFDKPIILHWWNNAGTVAPQVYSASARSNAPAVRLGAQLIGCTTNLTVRFEVWVDGFVIGSRIIGSDEPLVRQHLWRCLVHAMGQVERAYKPNGDVYQHGRTEPYRSLKKITSEYLRTNLSLDKIVSMGAKLLL